MEQKQYKTYLHIYGTLKGKRKPSHIEIDLTGLEILSPKCPIKLHIKEVQANFKTITKQVTRQYGYRESGDMVFRDLFPVNEHVWENYNDLQ